MQLLGFTERDLQKLLATLAPQTGLTDPEVRMTGCPNGCARPYIGDIGIVGRTQNAYVLFLGGDFEGTRLNEEFADLVPGEELEKTLVPMLSYFKEHRAQSERFGDFCHRVGVGTLRKMFPRTS